MENTYNSESHRKSGFEMTCAYGSQDTTENTLGNTTKKNYTP